MTGSSEEVLFEKSSTRPSRSDEPIFTNKMIKRTMTGAVDERISLFVFAAGSHVHPLC